MHILITNINGNPNIGLYGFANDKYCLLGREVPADIARKIGTVLNVPVYKIEMCGTSLIGVFCAGNSHCLLIPSISFEQERKQLDEYGIKYQVIESKLTALGNLVLCNDNGCLASPDFSADIKKIIRQALSVPLHPGTIAGLNITGSCASVNKQGCLIHRDASEEEIKEVESLLKIPCQTGTINMANPFISSGIICNSHGFVVGEASGGPEVNNADEAFGFLGRK